MKHFLSSQYLLYFLQKAGVRTVLLCPFCRLGNQVSEQLIGLLKLVAQLVHGKARTQNLAVCLLEAHIIHTACGWQVGEASTKCFKGVTQYDWKGSRGASVSSLHFYGDVELQRVEHLSFVVIVEKSKSPKKKILKTQVDQNQPFHLSFPGS